MLINSMFSCCEGQIILLLLRRGVRSFCDDSLGGLATVELQSKIKRSSLSSRTQFYLTKFTNGLLNWVVQARELLLSILYCVVCKALHSMFWYMKWFCFEVRERDPRAFERWQKLLCTYLQCLEHWIRGITEQYSLRVGER